MGKRRATRRFCPTYDDWNESKKLDIEQCQQFALDIYTFFVCIDECRKGNLPAWEGIRIVKEHVAA